MTLMKIQFVIRVFITLLMRELDSHLEILCKVIILSRARLVPEMSLDDALTLDIEISDELLIIPPFVTGKLSKLHQDNGENGARSPASMRNKFLQAELQGVQCA